MLSSIADTGCFVTDGNHTLPVPQQVGANWHGAIFLNRFSRILTIINIAMLWFL
jgi:hypothetical protein